MPQPAKFQFATGSGAAYRTAACTAPPLDPVERLMSGLERVQGHGDRFTARCPAHEDEHPSLSVSRAADGRALVNCFAGCSTQDVVHALGLAMRDLFPSGSETRARVSGRASQPPRADISADAEQLWLACLANATDDDRVEEFRPVFDYLAGRGLAEAWELRLFGIVARDQALPSCASGVFPRPSICAPLYDRSGVIRNLQARRIDRANPKVVSLSGPTSGLVFANEPGHRLLRGQHGRRVVVLAEGLTDYLAVATALSGVPVLGVPGASGAAACVGDWVKGSALVVAFDRDRAGERPLGAVAAAARERGSTSVSRVIWSEDCVDACDVVAQFGLAALEEFLSTQLGKGPWNLQ